MTEETPLSTVRKKTPVLKKLEKIQTEDELQISRCKDVLKKMSAVVARQKNVSIDIKKGLIEMEDALEILEQNREKWRSANKILWKQIDLRSIKDF